MRIFIFLHLIILVSCSAVPERKIASEPILMFGEVDASKSKIRLHQTDISQKENFYFYLELRNNSNKLVDVDLGDFNVRNHKRELKFSARRLTQGRYEIGVFEEIDDLSKTKFFVQKKVLAHKLVAFKKPVRTYTKLEFVSKSDYTLRLRLLLRDKSGLPLEAQHTPDIILEGLGDIFDLRETQKGVWEFSLAYPEQNQILYLSIRANGVLLERIFRFQHVEK